MNFRLKLFRLNDKSDKRNIFHLIFLGKQTRYLIIALKFKLIARSTFNYVTTQQKKIMVEK